MKYLLFFMLSMGMIYALAGTIVLENIGGSLLVILILIITDFINQPSV